MTIINTNYNGVSS